jgi:hypothetical protein
LTPNPGKTLDARSGYKTGLGIVGRVNAPVAEPRIEIAVFISQKAGQRTPSFFRIRERKTGDNTTPLPSGCPGEQVVFQSGHPVPGLPVGLLGFIQFIQTVLPVHQNSAYGTSSENLLLHSCHRKVGSRNSSVIAPCFLSGLHIEQSHPKVIRQFSTEARTSHNRYSLVESFHRIVPHANTPGEKMVGFPESRTWKDNPVLQKELSNLGKNNSKRLRLGTCLIHFYLTEIGIQRQVEVEARGDSHFGIGPPYCPKHPLKPLPGSDRRVTFYSQAMRCRWHTVLC